MRITASLATRDRPHMLELALHSLINQTHPDLEILVLDDGLQAANSTLLLNPRVRYIRRPGPPAPLGQLKNQIVQLATGELIMNADDDDWHGPYRASHQLALLLTSKKQCTGYHSYPYWDVTRRTAHLWTYSIPNRYAPGNTFFHTRQWALDNPYPNAPMSEDRAFWDRAYVFSQVATQPAGPNFVARWHPQHVSGTKKYPCPFAPLRPGQLPPQFFADLEATHQV